MKSAAKHASCLQRLEASAGARDKLRDVFGGRCRYERPHCTHLLDSTLLHHDNVVGEPSGFREVVRHQQRGDRQASTKPVERLVELSTRDGIERSERLVEKNDARPRRNASGESDTLTLPARKLVRESGAELPRRQSHELERSPRSGERIAHALKDGNERDVSQNSPVREKSAVLLDVADSTAQLNCRLGANITVADLYLAAFRLDQPVEATEKRRLSRTAFSNERNGSARRDIDAHTIERDDVPEAVRDIPCCQRNRHGLKSDSEKARPLSPP
jgi:hypothetical protein